MEKIVIFGVNKIRMKCLFCHLLSAKLEELNLSLSWFSHPKKKGMKTPTLQGTKR